MDIARGSLHFFTATCEKKGHSPDNMFDTLPQLLFYNWGESFEKYLDELREAFEKAKNERVCITQVLQHFYLFNMTVKEKKL